MISSTKFRLLLPYTEQVIFACPLIIPSAFKPHTIVIPIPIDSEIKVQRCLNMREIIQNKAYQELLGRCSEIINQYQNELSYIHFPLILSSPTKRASARTEPLFKKRSQSESHIELHASDFNKEIHRKSCDILNYTEDQDDQQRFNLKTIRKNSSNEQDPIEKVVKQSSYYTKIKIDKPRKYLRQQELDSDDENYRELDHIYDYIRSGDVTDDVQKIQAKEQALNAKFNQTGNTSRVCVSAVLNVSNTAIKNSAKQLPSKCNSLEAMQVQKFPSNLDDSRPLDNGGGDDDDNDDPSRTRCSTSRQLSLHNLTDSSNSKPTLRMSRIN
ncbi:hypothetical protein I4U23_018158 [Adineta vaga]|nr:hypothetical protein I4U23_018158 [Adineta vaga]